MPSTGADYRMATLERGAPLYTDRNYRIREVPLELEGEAFLQTANNDADADSGITVKVELRQSSTVYLADDARAD
ncbi:MAG: hypothetical protein GWO24_13415, partial [Akkermansiaceae bacterium]|nr:hypothetical protein [Akkermansiaceae bacterium]